MPCRDAPYIFLAESFADEACELSNLFRQGLPAHIQPRDRPQGCPFEPKHDAGAVDRMMR